MLPLVCIHHPLAVGRTSSRSFSIDERRQLRGKKTRPHWTNHSQNYGRVYGNHSKKNASKFDVNCIQQWLLTIFIFFHWNFEIPEPFIPQQIADGVFASSKATNLALGTAIVVENLPFISIYSRSQMILSYFISRCVHWQTTKADPSLKFTNHPMSTTSSQWLVHR